MSKKTIDLSIAYTPYTIDTYSTFNLEGVEMMLIEDHIDQTGDTELTYDSFEWEYQHKEYVQDLAESWQKLMCEHILDEVILNVALLGKAYSPREYNFTTDNCDVVFEVNQKALDKYINENILDFQQNKIKSCDGFIWLGNTEQQKLHYYLQTKTVREYSEDEYYENQMDNVPEYDYVSCTLPESAEPQEEKKLDNTIPLAFE